MANFTDGTKTNNSGTIVWADVKSLNSQVKIGNRSMSIKVPVGNSDTAIMDEAFKDILDILNPRTLGLITGRSRVTHRNADSDVPSDITGKHQMEIFTFRELRGGVESYPKIMVPFYVGNGTTGTADKATVGAQLAALLTGDLASYQFVS